MKADIMRSPVSVIVLNFFLTTYKLRGFPDSVGGEWTPEQKKVLAPIWFEFSERRKAVRKKIKELGSMKLTRFHDGALTLICRAEQREKRGRAFVRVLQRSRLRFQNPENDAARFLAGMVREIDKDSIQRISGVDEFNVGRRRPIAAYSRR